MRICSLLPSATEMVYALGLEDQLVGVSHSCDFPERGHRQAGGQPQHQKYPQLGERGDRRDYPAGPNQQ